jgi:hypothetical protein
MPGGTRPWPPGSPVATKAPGTPPREPLPAPRPTPAAALSALLACCAQQAPAGTVTETFAWVVTVFTVGTALGAALAGLAAPYGVGPASATAAGALTAGAVALIAGRRSCLPLAEPVQSTSRRKYGT